MSSTLTASDLSHATAGARASEVDFDLRGLVGVRLVDPAPSDVVAVSAQLGPPGRRLERRPDLTIRFVGEVQTGAAVRYVEPSRFGFTDDEFVLLLPDSRGTTAALLSYGSSEGAMELVCRSGFRRVPLLRPLLELPLLESGVAAVHACAFTYNGRGTMVAGFAGGAKTTTLVAFAGRGAEFVANDRLYVGPGRAAAFGLPEPVSLRQRHLMVNPALAKRVGMRGRARLRTLSALGSLAASLAHGRAPTGARQLAERFADFADDVREPVAPERLFERCPYETSLGTAILTVPHASSETRCTPVDPVWLVDRLGSVLEAERRKVHRWHLAFRFAFPDRIIEVMERAPGLEREILLRTLAGVETYVLHHPVPARPESLLETLLPVVG